MSSDATMVPTEEGPRARRQYVPALTILSHPGATAVSSRVYLDDTLSIARGSLAFSRINGGDTFTLNSPFVSRSPIVLTRQGDGVMIDPRDSRTRLTVNGKSLPKPKLFQVNQLREGVTICLAGRIALLLHVVDKGQDIAARSASDSAANETTAGDSAANETAASDAAAGAGASRFGIVGHSSAIRHVFATLETVAATDVPVLILGESGTGKELVARAIHQLSKRRDAAYEAVNMATLSSSLAGSELFGHVKGAFTGAERAHDGYFARTNGGTLFLDEVGDTPVEIQAQLLRVLETQDFRPLGAATPRRVDVRILSATDVNLGTAVTEGGFRQALVQRLAGFQIRVPPLRKRREDIGALFYHFARAELAAIDKLGLIDEPDTKHPWIHASVIARLARFPWPGNVRQLRNVVRQLVVAGHRRRDIATLDEVERLLKPLDAASTPNAAAIEVSTRAGVDEVATAAPATPPKRAAASYRDPSSVSEEELLTALHDNQYRMVSTARDLNISRTSLYALVEQSTRVRKASELSAVEIEEATASARGNLVHAAQTLGVSLHALKLRINALDAS